MHPALRVLLGAGGLLGLSAVTGHWGPVSLPLVLATGSVAGLVWAMADPAAAPRRILVIALVAGTASGSAFGLWPALDPRAAAGPAVAAAVAAEALAVGAMTLGLLWRGRRKAAWVPGGPDEAPAA